MIRPTSVVKDINIVQITSEKKFFKDLSAQTQVLKSAEKGSQLVLRNNVGSQMGEIIGFNPFVTKKKVEKPLQAKSESWVKGVDFQVSERNRYVAACTNVEATTKSILKK